MAGVITVSLAGNGVARVTMCDRAGANAMSEAFAEQLLDALARVARWPELKVVMLLGLPEVFCSGASPEVLAAVAGGAVVPSDLPLAEAVLTLPVPVIAAMEGHALGGGLALGLCADLVLIAVESRYGCPFMDLGFTPGMGMTGLLEHVLTPAVAHELLYTGEPVKGRKLLGRNGFTDVLPREQVRTRADELATRIAEKPRLALTTLKRTLAMPRRQAFERDRAMEALMHEITLPQPEVRRRIEERFDAC